MTHILAIDQGTTSTRAIVYDAGFDSLAQAQEEFTQHYPRSGWVEHDPMDLWQTTQNCITSALRDAATPATAIAAIGITNQRETVLLWDRKTGAPLHNAIVWQDRRTADRCATLRAAGHEEMITAKTGLVLDPYFSASKLAWMLDEIPDARRRAEAGELAFGTVDTWLIWHLTGGAAHVTDVTNAARTMLFDIHSLEWCEDILSLFNIPRAVLPNVLDCDAHFGTTAKDVIGAEIPIRAVAGDQQAATIGQACFDKGMAKVTYGTGCFALMNTGATAVPSKNKLLTTIAYRMDGQTAYALEGSIYIAGAVVQWLRDGLGIIASAAETQDMAKAADNGQAITLVPAFTGLAAPYWNSECRGAVFGLSRNTGPNELARAALQSVGLQTRDLMEAMAADMEALQTGQTVLRVDGGMSASDYTLQYVADILNAPVDRPTHLETTARGVAWLAGYKAGLYPDQAGFRKTWAIDRQFAPKMNADTRNSDYARWQRAVAATIAAGA